MQRVVLLGLVFLAVIPDAAAEPEHASLFEVLRESTASVDLRYRYEWVSDDAVGLDGHASTLRTALRYETGAYEGFGVFLEAENVSSVGAALYNNAGVAHLGNGRLDGGVLYEVEYARQRAAALNPLRIAASYLHLMAGAEARGLVVTAGWERLGGNPADGQFQYAAGDPAPVQRLGRPVSGDARGGARGYLPQRARHGLGRAVERDLSRLPFRRGPLALRGRSRFRVAVRRAVAADDRDQGSPLRRRCARDRRSEADALECGAVLTEEPLAKLLA